MPNSNEPMNQASYVPSPYESLTWERVGDKDPDFERFVQMRYAIVERQQQMADPMFKDFSGGKSRAQGMAKQPGGGLGVVDQLEQEKRRVALLESQIAELQSQATSAFEQGKAAGLAEAQAQVAAISESSRAAFLATLEDLRAQTTDEIALIERDGVALTLKLFEKLFGEIVEVKADYIGPIIKDALSYRGARGIKKIRVSPQDLEFIEVVGVSEVLQGLESAPSFEADPTIRSGCVIETEEGEIDRRLHEAWERVRDQIVQGK